MKIIAASLPYPTPTVHIDIKKMFIKLWLQSKGVFFCHHGRWLSAWLKLMSSCLCESKWWAGQMSHLALPKVNKQPFRKKRQESSASHDVCFWEPLLEHGGEVCDLAEWNNGKTLDTTAGLELDHRLRFHFAFVVQLFSVVKKKAFPVFLRNPGVHDGKSV